VYSPQSPLGQAVIGRKVGESVTYPAPNGNPINVTIESVDAM
ncbi:MAG TPA: transcription elongation factor GreA, partial [Propionibacteriaceae bacterium]|nr:transcription elongation factor GreA [Propionibacteriaceae bacterium]HBY24646.1 transcription elongation factor GreA [Propionibacteriaceae bacterium]